MINTIPSSVADKGVTMDPIVKVLGIERHLSKMIYSKGLLDEDVQELYRRACSDYENIILDEHQVNKLQEVEYQLWKLHYSHIEEFRKRIRLLTANAKDKKTKGPQDESGALVNLERHIDRFILFLSEATAFYDNLLRKFRILFGLPSYFLGEKTSSSLPIEATKMNRVQSVCHRFLICLGDIARYKEFCRKSEARNWSVAATCYLEAGRIWPYSGNAHNQLALLGTYVGDSYLSLYHCLRSLAVEEPFPDVWRNLMLLIEENRSSHLHFSSAAYIDFTKPHERILVEPMLEGTKLGPPKTDLWSLIVRVISFFIVSTSMEDFPHILASTVKELEALASFGEAELQDAMVSYKHITSSKIGPHRAIQLVTMFIFVVNSLIENSERERTIQNDLLGLICLALATTFLSIGRIMEACLKSKHLQNYPLLPSVLTFLEWLVSLLDKIEEHTADNKVSSSMSYFFSVLVDLLNKIEHGQREALTPDTALWEDHELRGFKPLSDAHKLLDFRTNQESMNDFTCGYVNRCLRISNAAKVISMRSKTWLSFDECKMKYCKVESMRFLGQRETEAWMVPGSTIGKGVENHKLGYDGEIKGLEINNGPTTAPAEDEEVILFKPIMRHNSAPLSSNGNGDLITEEKQITPEDSLRRAISLIDGQSQKQVDPFSFYPDTVSSNPNNKKLFKQQENLFKDSTTCAVGPPSLSGWVLNKGSPNIEREKSSKNLYKRELSPIREIASESLAELSINEPNNHIYGAVHVPASTYNHPSAYVSPVPSAPLLPDDAVWLTGTSALSQQLNRTVLSQEADGILGPSPLSGYVNYSAGGSGDLSPRISGDLSPRISGDLSPRISGDLSPRISGFVDVQHTMMSSSEWLYHYRNNLNMQRIPPHALPVNLNSPGLLGTFNPNEASRFGLLDQWGNYLVPNSMINLETRQVFPTPTAYAPDVQIGGKLWSGYQRSPPPSPSNMGVPIRADHPSLLQYLKDKERNLQRESQLGGANAFYGI